MVRPLMTIAENAGHEEENHRKEYCQKMNTTIGPSGMAMVAWQWRCDSQALVVPAGHLGLVPGTYVAVHTPVPGHALS